MFHTFKRLLSNKSRLSIVLLLALSLVVAQVNAASMTCRSDPIVFLSNGTKLQIGVAVNTSLDDLNSIQYEVHVPVGVSINRVIYTPQWARSKESVTLIADQAPDTYVVLTLVKTGTPNVPTTINARKFGNGDGLTHKVVTGVSGQVIRIGF
jgi:hypothetical protein